MGRKLVAYFSASGTTKKVAETVAQAGKFDLYEITPKEAYTKGDLEKAAATIAQGIKDYSTDKRGR